MLSEIEIKERDSILVIRTTAKKSLEWYLEDYDDELDRYDWGSSDEPKGREVL